MSVNSKLPVILSIIIILIFKGCNKDYDQVSYEDFIIITPHYQKIITDRVILEILDGTVLENTEMYINHAYNQFNLEKIEDSIYIIKSVISILPKNINLRKPVKMTIIEDKNWFYILDDYGNELPFNINHLKVFEVLNYSSYKVIENNTIIDTNNVYRISASINNFGTFIIGVQKKDLEYWGGSFIAKISSNDSLILDTIFNCTYKLAQYSWIKTIKLLLSSLNSTTIQIAPEYTENWSSDYESKLLIINTTANPDVGVTLVKIDDFNNLFLFFWSHEMTYSSTDTSTTTTITSTTTEINSIPNSEVQIIFTQFGGFGELVEGKFIGPCYLSILADTYLVDVDITFKVRRF